jgi:hypothetical protein
MGIGRREFFKFVAAAFGGMAVDPLQAVAIHGDYFVNTRLGLGFVKPRNWALEAFRDFASELKGQIIQGLPHDVDEEEFRRDQASTLVATVIKYSGAAHRFSPSITVFKNWEDYPEIRPEGLEKLAQYMIEGYSALLKDYEVLEVPRQFEVSRCKAIRFKSRWVFEHNDIEPVLIEDEALAIDQGSHLFSIHMYDSPATGEATPEEFACFLKSLHIA